MSDDDKGRPEQGRRYKADNVDAAGAYIVGKGRPPESGKFRTDDGRTRGCRPKGLRNFDTEFAEEAARIVPVRENGKVRRMSKQRASIVRTFDNGYSKGQNVALGQLMEQGRRLVDRGGKADRGVALNDQEIVDAYLRERAQALGLDPTLFGDPVAPPGADDGDAPPAAGSNPDTGSDDTPPAAGSNSDDQ